MNPLSAITKLKNKLAKLGTVPNRLRYTWICMNRLQIELLGPPGVGKTQLALAMARDLNVENMSCGFHAQLLRLRPAQSPHRAEAESLSQLFEWFSTRQIIVKAHPGERLRGPVGRGGNQYLYIDSLVRQFQRRADRLMVLVINPFCLQGIAHPSLLALTRHIATCLSDSDKFYLAVKASTAALFEMPDEEIEARLASIWVPKVAAQENTAAVGEHELAELFAGCRLEEKSPGELRLEGGNQPEVARYLLRALAKQAEDEHTIYVQAVRTLTAALKNTVVVFSHADLQESIAPLDFTKIPIFSIVDQQIQRSADDRLWVSSARYLLDFTAAGPQRRIDLDSPLGANRVLERVMARLPRARRAIRWRWANAGVGLVCTIGIATLLFMLPVDKVAKTAPSVTHVTPRTAPPAVAAPASTQEPLSPPGNPAAVGG